jgi:uncharacterized protein
MDISDQQWNNIIKLFSNSTHATASPILPYCAFSTVNEDGTPRVAPYSSMILGENKQGFYFDELSQHTSSNIERNQRICVLIVKTNIWFWIKTVFLGRYDHPPGIRLMGSVGKKREATEQEINAFKKPLRSLKFFKGYKPIWGFMKQGREIYFDAFEPVKCRTITEVETI